MEVEHTPEIVVNECGCRVCGCEQCQAVCYHLIEYEYNIK